MCDVRVLGESSGVEWGVPWQYAAGQRRERGDALADDEATGLVCSLGAGAMTALMLFWYCVLAAALVGVAAQDFSWGVAAFASFSYFYFVVSSYK